MSLVFIVTAAGKGKRFGWKKNKLLYTVNSKPLIWYTLKNIEQSSVVDKILLVVDKDSKIEFQKIVKESGFEKVIGIINGGEERQGSVYNGLKWLNKNFSDRRFFVGIHDGARINIGSDLIKRVYKEAKKYKAAIPVVYVTDTVKRVDDRGFVVETVERKNRVLVQTPQIFDFNLIFEAYKRAEKDGMKATDDASLAEYSKIKVKCVDGESENIKITTKNDLKIFDTFKVGVGFDVHRIGGNKKYIYLGGVKIGTGFGVVAHSDGDVLIHSIIDALLGALGKMDIGEMFPDNDKRFKNIRSTKMLKQVLKILRDDNYQIVNLDALLLLINRKFLIIRIR